MVQASWWLKTGTPPPFGREVVGIRTIVWVKGEGRRWGGVKTVEDRRLQGFDDRGGVLSSNGMPSLPQIFQVIAVAKVRRSENLALGLPVGQSQGWPIRHWLEPVGKRTASEGALFLMM